jgi:hypothetical protein
MVRMSINLCRFLPSTLGSSICATWSVILILDLSFTLFGTFFFYFYNDFTIRASLVNLYIISPPYLSRFLIYVLYLHAFALPSLGFPVNNFYRISLRICINYLLGCDNCSRNIGNKVVNISGLRESRTVDDVGL